MIKKRKSIKIDLDALRYWHARGKSDTWIAGHLGVSQTGVSRARQKLSLVPNFLCHINDNDKEPHELYADYIHRGRDYKKENKDILRKKQKIAHSTREYRKKHREYERARRSRKRALRHKDLLREKAFVRVGSFQKSVTINGKRTVVDVEGHLRSLPEKVEEGPQRVEFKE